MTDFISLSEPWLTDVETQHVLEAINSGWLTQSGAAVRAMENTLLRCGSKNDKVNSVTTCSNGTTALHLALLAVGVTNGDEVIVPNFSYVAVVNAVIYCGATPVVVDVNLFDWCISSESLSKALTSKTKAIIVVDNYGFKANTDSIRKIVGEDTAIIRDAAEAFPEKGGELIFGAEDLVTTSFYANKIVTSGEGGAIWGPRKLIDQICVLKNQAVEAAGSFNHVSIGYNYRLSNLHAAVFNAQWSRIDEIFSARREIFNFYSKAFSSEAAILSHNGSASPWLFTMRISAEFSVKKIRNELKLEGIETRPGFTSFSDQTHLRNKIQVLGPQDISVQLQESLISLPTNPKMELHQLERIAAAALKLLQT